MAGEFHVDRRRELYPGGVVGRLAIMRGCNLNCSFCVVPAVRGRVQSRPIAELLDEARWMLDGGARVIELLGQTVNSYGEDLPRSRGRGRQGRPGLADLIHAMQVLDGLERIRLVTLHPAYLTQALVRAMAECNKLERFLPLPAQAGSDAVLRRMKRGYTVDEYRRRLALLREEVPDVELGSDWIVGFPGESDADFALTEALLEEVGFVQNFVFQYDERPGTSAALLVDDVPAALKKERHQRLLELAERVALRRLEDWIGRTVEVLVEGPGPRGAGRVQGRTRHNISVSLPGEEDLLGCVLSVRIGDASAYGLAGVPA
jgi:tRNA-2-methylthio-N6-dimethylallyladenosine synthase